MNEIKTHYSSLIQKFVPTKEIYTFKNDEIQEIQVGKNFIYKFRNPHLKKVQNKLELYRNLNAELNKIELNNASIAFRKKSSYLHFFEPHRKNYNFLRLDIRSFFHSIKIEDIEKMFKNYIYDTHYIDEGKTESVLSTFLNIVTYEIPYDSKNETFKGKRVLPMGFLTSPVISNIIFRPLDIQIQKLCSQKGLTYTRYADDMLFSSSKDLTYIHTEVFMNEIQLILTQMKFKLNDKKILKAKHTLALNGYILQFSKVTSDNVQVINELRFSSKKTAIIEKMIYMINKREKTADFILTKLFKYKIKLDVPYTEINEKYNREQLLNKILGYRSFLLSIIQFDKKYHCTQENTIAKYLKIIDDLEKISEKFQKEITALEIIIESNKPFHRMAKIKIDSLNLTAGIKDKLKKESFKTLKDLHGVNEEKLMNIKGIGKVKAKKILEVIVDEIKKYK